MDRSDINRWAKAFSEILYVAGQVSILMKLEELFTMGKMPSGFFELEQYAVQVIDEVSEKMKAFPLDQLQEVITWEQSYPLPLRSSLSLEEKLILDNLTVIQNFDRLRKTIGKWRRDYIPADRLVEAPVTSRRLITTG